MKTLIHFFVLSLLCLSFSTRAQIIDDSTKLIYGPTSTRWISVEDLQHNDTLFHTMDTTLSNIESFQVKYRQADYHYDLGNNGTALVPVYYNMPQEIGRKSGFHAYDGYTKSAADVKYFDTKSPYANLNIALGGTGRNFVDFQFSRNISPEWNFGFDITRVASLKQLGSASLREKQILGTGLDFYTYYHTKKRKYHVMFHLYKFDHDANETGGITSDTEEDEYFQYLDATINLSTAYSADYRTRMYMYQQVSIKPFFEIFNSVSRSSNRNEYNDVSPNISNGTTGYYNQALVRTDSTRDATLFQDFDTKVGIKGRVANRIFYSGYVRRRDIDYSYRYLPDQEEAVENYLGGDLKIWVTPTNKVGGRVEVMDEGLYYLKGYFENGLLRAEYSTNKYLPSMMTQRYFGNHYEWTNSFGATFANSIKASVYYQFPFLRLEPQVELTSLANYIYFNQNKLPAQNDGTILINKYGVKADFKLGHFRLDNHLIFNDVAGQNPEVMRIPDLNWYGRWYYENIFFGDQMEMQIGLDLHWQSAYTGRAYDPITQQFYLQNSLRTEAYLRSDLFLIVKSFDLTLFLKVNYLNQGRDQGYFEVPYYPGMRRAFDMGIRWMFFE